MIRVGKEEHVEISAIVTSYLATMENPLSTMCVQIIILMYYVMALLLQLLTCFFCPQDDELVIVYDGALCFAPWPAVSEAIRIRTVPSLTSCQLILSVPEGHNKKTGALLAGNPCLKELKGVWYDLPCAQNVVELIALILNTRPLVGRLCC